MSRRPTFSRRQMVTELTKVFLDHGYGGAHLTALGDAVGLNKATLYHHFPGGKAVMASEVLAQAGARLQHYVLSPLTCERPVKERLKDSLEGVALYYDGDHPACVMNALLIGAEAEQFRDRVAQALRIWTKALDQNLAELGVMFDGSAVISRIQGALVLSRATGSRQPLDDALHALMSEL